MRAAALRRYARRFLEPDPRPTRKKERSLSSVFSHGPTKQPAHPRASLLLLSKETNFPVRLSKLSRPFSLGTDFLVVLYDLESFPT